MLSTDGLFTNAGGSWGVKNLLSGIEKKKSSSREACWSIIQDCYLSFASCGLISAPLGGSVVSTTPYSWIDFSNVFWRRIDGISSISNELQTLSWVINLSIKRVESCLSWSPCENFTILSFLFKSVWKKLNREIASNLKTHLEKFVFLMDRFIHRKILLTCLIACTQLYTVDR